MNEPQPERCPECGSDDPDRMVLGPLDLKTAEVAYCPDPFHDTALTVPDKEQER